MTPFRDIAALLEIMRRLRAPDGCPWDLRQSFQSIAPYTIEEAYEVADAIERGDMGDLADELGDLLLQVVFHAQMASEIGAFEFGDVVECISRKMVRRHPHVFGDRTAATPEAVKTHWDEIKAAEKAERAARRDARTRAASILDEVPRPLPALTRALKLQKKAGAVGFDWNGAHQVIAKLKEEIGEIEEALDTEPAQVGSEIGDLLFVVVNLARHLKVDPETALREANAKFVRRFRFIEESLAARGRSPDRATLEEMDQLWDEAKAAEKAS
jgi:ATP diphosphatase